MGWMGMDGGEEGGGRTEDELLDGRVDVHAEGHFDLVDLELQPLAEGLEAGGHGGRIWVVWCWIV
jgi:hypothetical protein